MKLRNKKTGEIFNALIREKGGLGLYTHIVCDIKAYERNKGTKDEKHYVLGEYTSLAELNEEWEDYKPAEPLIKDEKIRKAVRAWAEANDIDGATFYTSSHFWYLRTFNDRGQGIDFWLKWEDKPKLIEAKDYTIAELCGEEEEKMLEIEFREIKFRAFDTENKTWTFVTLGDLVCGACTENGDKPLSGAKQAWEQYTGLKDKNGKEIYEGDIVDYNDDGECIGVVKYDAPEFYLDADATNWARMFLKGAPHQRVIGNIHENHELLEQDNAKD